MLSFDVIKDDDDNTFGRKFVNVNEFLMRMNVFDDIMV